MQVCTVSPAVVRIYPPCSFSRKTMPADARGPGLLRARVMPGCPQIGRNASRSYSWLPHFRFLSFLEGDFRLSLQGGFSISLISTFFRPAWATFPCGPAGCGYMQLLVSLAAREWLGPFPTFACAQFASCPSYPSSSPSFPSSTSSYPMPVRRHACRRAPDGHVSLVRLLPSLSLAGPAKRRSTARHVLRERFAAVPKACPASCSEARLLPTKQSLWQSIMWKQRHRLAGMAGSPSDLCCFAFFCKAGYLRLQLVRLMPCPKLEALFAHILRRC